MTYPTPTLSELPPPPAGETGWPWTEESQPFAGARQEGLSLPRISIVTPSYNQGQFIEKTIRSVLLQGYPNLEYIVMDGGSTDNSVEVIRKYEPWITYWVSERDRGQADAINKGWDKAQGEILHWLNSDDYLMPNALHSVAQAFVSNDQIQAVSGICSITNTQGEEFCTKPPRDFDLAYFLGGGEAPGQPAVFLRSDLVQQVGKLSESLHYTLDWEYWLRISQAFPSMQTCKLNQTLAVWYQWEDCKSVEQRAKSYGERLQTLDRIFADPNLPENIKQLRRTAYGLVLSKQALALAQVNQREAAVNCSLKGMLLNPSLFSVKQAIKVITGFGY